jgi:hypothetical protein
MGLDFGGRTPLMILDRGYPSNDLVKFLQDKEIKFVMRVGKKFNSGIDGMETGSKDVPLGEGINVRAVVFPLASGEREALITNLGEDEVEKEAFPGLYYKRWPIETKYSQVKQKLELENFSGRLVDNIRQDFYAMMTVANMLASALREANRNIEKEGKQKERHEELKHEYRANVNHAVGVLKDRLIGILITDDPFVRHYLFEELVSEIKRRVVPVRTGRKVQRKESLKKPHFHHNHKSNC